MTTPCIALLLLVSCRDSTETELADSRAILYGRVTDTAGSPIAGARITLTYHPAGCSVTARNRTTATTGTDGRYRELFNVVSGPFGCVQLRAQASGFVADSVTRFNVQFRSRAPYDSVATIFSLRR